MNVRVSPKYLQMELCLAKNLRNLLHESKMTASALSRKAEVPTTTISNWLAGQSPRNIEQVYRVSCFFGVSLEELIFGVKPSQPRDSDPLNDLNSEIHAGIYEVVLRKPRK